MRAENLTTIEAFKPEDNHTKIKKLDGIQKVFRGLCIILFLILVFCLPGFLKFRDYCTTKQYHVFSADSFAWCGLGFFLVFVHFGSFRPLSMGTWF